MENKGKEHMMVGIVVGIVGTVISIILTAISIIQTSRKEKHQKSSRPGQG